ncbi:MAG: hypothetical protein ACFFCS_20465 [Candidatus Hodarchaeota archaeon]
MKARIKKQPNKLPETIDLETSLENMPAKFEEMDIKDLKSLFDAGFRNKRNP